MPHIVPQDPSDPVFAENADVRLARKTETLLRGADRDLEGGGHRSGGGFEAFFGVGGRALGGFEAATVGDQADDFRI